MVDAPRFLALYRLFAPVVAGAIVLGTIALLSIFSDQSAIGLTPLIVAPFATTWGLSAVGQLQREHRWQSLATGQLIAAIGAAFVSVPLLLITHSIIAASLQVLIAEALNAAWCRRQAGWRSMPRLRVQLRTQALNVHRESEAKLSFFAMVRYSGLAWAQGQLDRVVLGVLAGASALGAFSIASALARSIGDPLAASTANLLRSRLAQSDHSDPRAVREVAQAVTLRALLLATISFLIGVTGAIFAGHILDQQWQNAISITPILAISCLPAALNWSGSALQVAVGRANRAIWAPAVGVAIAPLVGLAAAFFGLEAAAWLVIVREFAVLTMSYSLVRAYAPWRSYVVCFAGCVVLSALMSLPPIRYLVGL